MAKSICSLDAVDVVVASVVNTAKKVIDIVTGCILDPSLFACLIDLSDKDLLIKESGQNNDKIQNKEHQKHVSDLMKWFHTK